MPDFINCGDCKTRHRYWDQCPQENDSDLAPFEADPKRPEWCIHGKHAGEACEQCSDSDVIRRDINDGLRCEHGTEFVFWCRECDGRNPIGLPVARSDSYDAARNVIPSIKAGREHAAYEIGVSEGRKQAHDEIAALRAERDAWKHEAETGHAAAKFNHEKVERMRPVAEAIEAPQTPNYAAWLLALASAANAFRAAQQETPDA